MDAEAQPVSGPQGGEKLGLDGAKNKKRGRQGCTAGSDLLGSLAATGGVRPAGPLLAFGRSVRLLCGEQIVGGAREQRPGVLERRCVVEGSRWVWNLSWRWKLRLSCDWKVRGKRKGNSRWLPGFALSNG